MSTYKRYILPECKERDKKWVVKLKSHTEDIKRLLEYVDINVKNILLWTTCPFLVQDQICEWKKVYEYTYKSKHNFSRLVEVSLKEIEEKILSEMFK